MARAGKELTAVVRTGPAGTVKAPDSHERRMHPTLFDDLPVTPTPAAPAPVPAPEPGPAAGETLVVATDGSCLRNPGPGGWAAAVVIGYQWADPHRWLAGGEPGTTNNAMELTAIATVLHTFADHPGELCIQTDSRYAIDALTKWVHGWRKRGWRTGKGDPVKNLEVIQLADALLDARRRAGRPTRFEWVKGHAGQPANEFVDDRARLAATAVKRGGNVVAGPGLVAAA